MTSLYDNLFIIIILFNRRYHRTELPAPASQSPASRHSSTSAAATKANNPFQLPSATHHQKPSTPTTPPAAHGAVHAHNHHAPGIIYSNPYGESSGYLQMALGAYLAPSSGGAYKSVDPYFLSQGESKYYDNIIYLFLLRTNI